MIVLRLFALLLAFAVPLGAQAKKPAISDLAAEARNSRISVRFALQHAFERDEINKALESGLPTGFTYHVELVRKRPNWFDKRLVRTQIEVVCSYNSVTREYLLNYRRDRRLVRSETFSDLEQLRRRMTTIDEPELFDAGRYRPYKLAVRVRADVMRGFLLHMIPVDVSTPWEEERVRTTRGGRR